MKKLLVQDTGLQPQEQRLLFRGKEKEDGEPLHLAGVKDKAKLILVEDPAAREKKMLEQRKLEHIARTCQAINKVRGEVDKLSTQACLCIYLTYGAYKVQLSDFLSNFAPRGSFSGQLHVQSVVVDFGLHKYMSTVYRSWFWIHLILILQYLLYL